jgi:hypothetical protein
MRGESRLPARGAKERRVDAAISNIPPPIHAQNARAQPDSIFQFSNSQRTSAKQQTHLRGLAAPAPELCEGLALSIEKRAQGRPDAGRTHGPRANKNARGRNHRYEPNNRPSLRDGLRLTPSSPRGPGSFAPVTPKARVARSRSLASASGCQDHTAWPSASKLFVRPRIARDNPDCVHRIPRSTLVTIAKRPLIERGTRGEDTNFGKNEIGIFFGAGLDRGDRIETAGEIGFFGAGDFWALRGEVALGIDQNWNRFARRVGTSRLSRRGDARSAVRPGTFRPSTAFVKRDEGRQGEPSDAAPYGNRQLSALECTPAP